MTEPIATVLLIVVTSCVSIWAFQDPAIERRFIFSPEGILALKEYYRLVTAAFLHAGWGHLLLNMYTLYHFGGAIEWQLGPPHFLCIYGGGVIGGNLLSLYLHRHHEYAAYGASGGVCGLIFAYVLMHPESRMVMFPLPYAVPAWVFAIGFMIASFYAMKVQTDNIGHDAHLGGAIIGLLVTAVLHPELLRRHWAVFLLLLGVSALMFAYVFVNPMFLPLSSFLSKPSWRVKFTWGRKHRSRVGRTARPPVRKPTATEAYKSTESDWLIDEIEIQVGKLRRDDTGGHDWIDRFGRTYKVLTGRADNGDLGPFKKAIMDQLSDPGVNFVIVDTRHLEERHVNALRPFLADLPDHQFHRVIHSFAFKQPRRNQGA